MDKPHVNLIIATPGHSLMSGYVRSLLNTINELSKKGLTFAFTNLYASHVADAREATLNGSMENNIEISAPLGGQCTYDKIIWIDSDIAWEPQDVLKLYESDKDIISGAYLLQTGEVTAYKEMFKRGFTFEEVKKMKEPIQIESCGFGFLCVKQGVFESLQRPWFQQERAIATIDNKEIDMPIMGEDMSWCQRVRKQGYEIWFDPTVRVTHHKMMQLTWEGIRA
mgnify:CR=1 FL=1